MAIWLVRAGRNGEREALALERNVATIGWTEMPDLGTFRDRDEMRRSFSEHYSAESAGTLANWTGQCWRFAKEIAIGDVIAMPLKSRPAVQFGNVTGPYKYEPSFPPGTEHTHAVNWAREVPRAQIDQDLLFSLGSTMTVARISRNDAEQRFRAMMSRVAGSGTPQGADSTTKEDGQQPESETLDIEEFGLDSIRRHIRTKFAGHGLARLVEAVLIAQGYKTHRSPPGADRGVDILAGRGPHGLDSPRLCVQVKSGDIPIDVKVFRELDGILGKFKADNGLLVSFGGFRSSIPGETQYDYFRIRLWNDADLIEALTTCYENLPEDVKADIPLKRVWTLATEE
ncbi:MAG TPA: restriction endonuclease [Candidatus Baltobacteraceae bacterium]|jgi:restriction system protein